MGTRRKISTDKLALAEARRATRWQVVAVITAVVFSLTSLILTLVLTTRQESKAKPSLRVTSCPAHIFHVKPSILTTCVSFKPGASETGMPEGVRVSFSNVGGSGITVNAMSLVCDPPAHCGMYNMTTNGGDQSANSLPRYLAPGQSSDFTVPMGCDHSVLGVGYGATRSVTPILYLSDGSTFKAPAVSLARPSMEAERECKSRQNGTRN